MNEPNAEKKTDAPISFLGEEKTQEETEQLFLFELDGELYSVSVGDVDQVMKIPPITPVPNAPQSISGIFHLRGKVIVVLDLLRRLRLSRTTSLFPYYLFVVHRKMNYFAILVDRTRTVVRVPKDSIRPVDPVVAAHIPPRYAKGMFMHRELATLGRRLKSNIMIEPPSALKEHEEEQYVEKPVIWLNIEELLDQDDLAGFNAESEGG